MNPGHGFQQDNAPSHNAATTREELSNGGIPSLVWPPFSPDLNIIEDVWNKMKDYIEACFPERISYDQLRVAVKERVDLEWLKGLVATLPGRMEAVIAADGMHIPY